MKRIMATALAVTVLATPVLAEETSTDAPLVPTMSSNTVMGDSMAGGGGILIGVLALVLIGAALHSH